MGMLHMMPLVIIWGEQGVIAGVCSSEGDFLFMSVLLQEFFTTKITSCCLSMY